MAGVSLGTSRARAAGSDENPKRSAEQELILTGTKAALDKSLFPALRELAYPGHFVVVADGGGYGAENTWPGLDSWQMAGAYLLAGRQREVLDYFDFVEASQRKDGNIPFAIFPGDQPPAGTNSWLRGLRFPEDVYIHPGHGLVDLHGLSDVNWAAIGFEIATGRQREVLWPMLTNEPGFWRGGLPTHVVTKPDRYEAWELSEPLPFRYTKFTQDVAAMGRVWYLEALACLAMKDDRRLRASVVKVCETGKKTEWFWHERYHADGDAVKPAGVFRYCEYPAILVRVVLGNPGIFPEAGELVYR